MHGIVSGIKVEQVGVTKIFMVRCSLIIVTH